MACKSFPLASALVGLALRRFVKGTLHSERIPTPPFVLVSNHSSFMDGIVLASAFAKVALQPLHVVSIAEPFKNPIWGWVLRSGQSIPLDRNSPRAGEAMMELAVSYLRRGEPVGLFAEGHVNNGVTMRKPRAGSALLALETGVPVLPVGIRHSNKALPMGARFPTLGKVVEVSIGHPIETAAAHQAYHGASRDERTELVRRLMQQMIPAVAREAQQNPPPTRRRKTRHNQDS